MLILPYLEGNVKTKILSKVQYIDILIEFLKKKRSASPTPRRIRVKCKQSFTRINLRKFLYKKSVTNITLQHPLPPILEGYFIVLLEQKGQNAGVPISPAPP